MAHLNILRNYTTYFVDLDGTLIDSEKSIRYSFQIALDKLNITPLIRVSRLKIGPPLYDNLTELIGRNCPEKLDLLGKTFIQTYDHSGWNHFATYENLIEHLKIESGRGKRLVLLTNKRTIPTMKIIGKMSMKDVFNEIYCVDSFQEVVKSKEILLKLILSNGHSQYRNSLLIGDTDSDLNAARSSNMDFMLFEKGVPKLHYKFNLD